MSTSFSIIIINYNNHREIGAVLESINNIKYPTHLFEIIIVDDGSTPKINIEQLTKLNCQHQLLYIERTEESSRSNARNHGASNAQFDWLIFIDGDQILNPRILENYTGYIEAHPDRSVVLGSRIDLTEWQSAELISNGNNEQIFRMLRKRTDFRLDFNDFSSGRLAFMPGAWTLLWSCNFLIHKKAFHSVGGFDTAFIHWGFEDTELGYRLYKNGYIFDVIENLTYHLYEENKMHQEKYYYQMKNMEYFYKKHNDISIMYQLLFYHPFVEKYGSGSEPSHQEIYGWFLQFSNRVGFFDKK